MDTEIIVAFIGFAGILAGAFLGYLGKSRHQAVLDAHREQKQMDQFALIFSEMNEIKKRLDEHNRYAEKFGDIEKTLISIKKDIEYFRKGKYEKN